MINSAATTPGDEQRPAPRRGVAFWFIAASYFAVVTVALFGPDLLWRPRAVISAAEMDIDRQFYAWREFAFGEWRATGRPPLWNPYAFGGAPALGNVQYALLYPPNWLHFLLPTAWAINLIAALHAWLAGVLTAAWCRFRGRSIVASLAGGTIFALSGPYLLHLYAGHLTYVCVVAWTPLIFLAIDGVVEATAPQQWVRATLLGAVAVAMQVLAGYPQPAFYTLLAAVVYAGVRLISSAPDSSPTHSVSVDRVRVVALLLGMYLGGAALSAAQWLPALDAARESVRAGATEYAFASSYSLPPENLLTLVVPYPFGDDFSAPYAGRWVMWEMSLYVGGVAAALAACALVAPNRVRHAAVVVVLVLAILFALGAHTPLFRVMYEVVPGVGRFRAPARFAFLAALMVSALAAAGVDALRARRFPHHRMAAAAGVAAAALFAASLLASNIRQLDGAALVLAQLAVIVLLAARWPRVVHLLPLLLLFELWRPAARAMEWFRPRPAPAALASVQRDERVVTTSERFFNLATRHRVEDAWGYDPATAARWADLVGPLLGADARHGDFAATKDVSETADSPIWPMLRVRHAPPPPVTQPFRAEPMPRVALLTDFAVVDGPAASLAAVRAADFDPRRRVILESAPAVAPAAGAGAGAGEGEGEDAAGVATVVGRTTDSLTIEAELARPAILLITDAYSAGWRATPPHQIMPANHALRAIALSAGRHHIRLQYRPPSVRIGAAISLATIIVVVAGVPLAAFLRRRARARRAAVAVARARAPAGAE